MARRKTIGDNPLDAVIPAGLGIPPSAIGAPAARGQAQAQAPARTLKPTRVQKERLTVHLPLELIDRVKNAVYWTPGLTLASLSERALRRIVDELEAERGEAYPHREQELKGGRPLK
jgi:hypothetical protein